MRDLEDYLARRACPEPSAELRTRILGGLVDAPPPILPRSSRLWRRAWQTAAVVVVVLNVVMTVENEIRFGDLNTRMVLQNMPKPPAEPWPDPDLYEENRGWESLTAHTLASLVRSPNVGVLSRNYFRDEENHAWVMP